MGTRHLIVVMADGQHRIAQYGQFDGYPSCQGVRVLNFLKNTIAGGLLDVFKTKCLATRYLSDDEARARWKEVGADDSGWVNMEIARKMEERYPELCRETSAAVLEIVLLRDPGVELRDDFGFGGDGLFCEWAYLIDLDKRTLGVYAGFNKGKVAEEHPWAQSPQPHAKYGPVGLLKTYSFEELVELSDEQFVEDLTEPEDEGKEETVEG